MSRRRGNEERDATVDTENGGSTLKNDLNNTTKNGTSVVDFDADSEKGGKHNEMLGLDILQRMVRARPGLVLSVIVFVGVFAMVGLVVVTRMAMKEGELLVGRRKGGDGLGDVVEGDGEALGGDGDVLRRRFDAEKKEVEMDGGLEMEGGKKVDDDEGEDPDRGLVEQLRESKEDCYTKFEPGKLGSKEMLCVTDEFFFDIAIGDKHIGRMVIGVFGSVVPKSAANFRALATCTGAFADPEKCYKGDSFHRVVTNFVAQGGSKATGRSIFGGTFREEQSSEQHSWLSHGEAGVVAWAEYPIGSQFYIILKGKHEYLDKNHVVFGVVMSGQDVLEAIHTAPRVRESPTERIVITDCGDVHERA
eukprot:Plantae.Rhodophyta-Hildenbrandia_rubra.ctg7283.p1 GENE.Plantae.Rhodophyta-Hildenbrandia_rubra.ctg7283~~Plantae.Rhodophyta-Hildenbrandia_rubra.ctg7283.p1  ORF type:complete len:362 (+),score=98.94 Plantae.Rhodophyta-Hildenbrandia_rubra.ctg7283:168-1253(+)